MGPSPILSVIHTITFDAIPNFYGGNNGHRLKRLHVQRPLNMSNNTSLPFNHPSPNYNHDHDGTTILIF